MVALLAWEHSHGGIARHHVLNRADWPAVSNAWGALVWPMLAWLAFPRLFEVRTRRPSIAAFVGSVAVGALLSLGFVQGWDDLTAGLFIGLFVAGLALPVYRAECVFGFVVGMTWVFGAVLPTLVALVVAALSWAVHRTVHPLLARLWRARARQSRA